MKVVFYEAFSEEIEMLQKFLNSGIEAEYREGTIQSYPEKSPPSHLISIRTQSIIPTQWSEQLSGILTRSTGFDHLRKYLSQCDTKVSCGYLPEYCARAVAEHAILMVLSLLKKIRKQLSHFQTFNRNGLTGGECHQNKLLVVGVGKIGREIVQLAKGMGMIVKGVDLEEREKFVDYVSLEEGLAFSDTIVCALPLTNLTKNLLNYEKLKNVKKGALFINVSRGEVSPIEDLDQLINEGVLGGVAMDVFEEECDLAASLQDASSKGLTEYEKLIKKMQQHENVIFTPHNAFNTLEGLVRKSELSVLSIHEFVDTQKFPYDVPR
jgi:D-lactate dehydrogenase